jgi:hypothetical protein
MIDMSAKKLIQLNQVEHMIDMSANELIQLN